MLSFNFSSSLNSFKITEEGVVLLQAPGLVSADNSGDVPEIIVGNTKDTCSFTEVTTHKSVVWGLVWSVAITEICQD